MKLKIVQNRKYFYAFSGTLVLISLLAIFVWGLKPGIDFVGGSLLEVKFTVTRPSVQDIEKSLTGVDLGAVQVQPSNESNAILKFKAISEATHQEILSKLNASFAPLVKATDVNAKAVTEERFETVGPSLGNEIKQKAIVAIILASIVIVLYVAYVFRHVSKPVVSWKYGVAAIISLAHDLIITTGLFAVLGHFTGAEVNGLFVAALLTILGYSINDTIVVYDRTRENLKRHYSADFENVVNDSVNQTMARSINTTLTTLLPLLCLFFFGGASIQNFALALLVGITSGAYSSILASHFIVTWYNFDRRKL